MGHLAQPGATLLYTGGAAGARIYAAFEHDTGQRGGFPTRLGVQNVTWNAQSVNWTPTGANGVTVAPASGSILLKGKTPLSITLPPASGLGQIHIFALAFR